MLSKQTTANKAMNIISNNPSHVASLDMSTAGAQVLLDSLPQSFSSNFKILNIATVRSPTDLQVGPLNSLALAMQYSTESRTKGSSVSSRWVREHRHMAIKSAFSEEVTGKNTIEVNANAVTKHLQVTLLCLRQEVGLLFQQHCKQASFSSSKKSKTSAFDVQKNAAAAGGTAVGKGAASGSAPGQKHSAGSSKGRSDSFPS